MKKLSLLLLFSGLWFCSLAQDVSLVSSSPACQGTSNGSITIGFNVENFDSGWMFPFEVSWENISTGATGLDSLYDVENTIENLPSGDYEITISLSDVCELVTNVTVEMSEMPSFNTNIQPDCGSNNGSISITVETDSPDTEVRIAWSNMQTGGTITNLAAGVYTVTISTSEGCEITEDITVPGSPAGWSDEIRVGRTVECMCDATPIQAFEVTYPDNQGPFYFQWTGPGGYTSTEQNPVDISVADQYYILTVTNDVGCSRVYSMYLPACPAFNPPIEFEVFPECAGAGGGVTANVPGWNPQDLDYQWSNGSVIQFLRNIPADRYNVTITNDYGCSITGRVDVPDMTDTPTFTLNSIVTPACVPNTGSIALNPLGGTPPYDVRWSYPGATGSTLSFINGGSYSVTVTDNNGCAVEEYFYVSNGPMVRADVVPASCMGRADGSIHLNITGSVSNNIIWGDGNGHPNQLVRDNLLPDVYCVTVTSPQGCQVQQCYDLRPTEPNTFAPYLQRVDVYAVPGGQHLYSGHWRPTSDGCAVFDGGVQAISPQLMQSMAGGGISWRVEMVFSEDMGFVDIGYHSDAGVSNNYFINSLPQGQPFVFTIAENDVADMSAAGSISMGFKVIGQDVRNNSTLDMLTLSNDLTRCVEIPYLDPATCKWTPELVFPTVGADQTHRIEFKCMSAEIVAEGNMFCLDLGGTPMSDIASIRWTRPNGTSTPGLSNGCLTPTDYGTYCVRIRTHSGCEVKLCAEYCKPPEINGPNETITNPDCPGGAGGSICLDVSAAEPLFFTWSNGQQGNCIEDLPAGEYRVSITVASGCELTQGMPAVFRYGIEDDGKPLDFMAQSTPACPGSANGSASVYPEGGQAPHTIVWADGRTDNYRNDLAMGCHRFTIVDACGTVLEDCVEVGTLSLADWQVTVLESSPTACLPELVLSMGAIAIPVQVTITHTSLGVSFVQQGQGILTFENLPAGEYQIRATVCAQEQIIFTTVSNPEREALNVSAETTPVDCITDAEGRACLTVSGGIPPYQIAWGNGSSGFCVDGLPFGETTFQITDACGDRFNGSVNVGLSEDAGNPPSVKNVISSASCPSEGTGKLEFMLTGGQPPFQYVLTAAFDNNNPPIVQDTPVFGGLSPAAYRLVVIDECGHQYDMGGYIYIVEEQFFQAELSITNVCQEEELGYIGASNIQLTGVSPRLSFLWSDGSTERAIEDAAVGSYMVTITEMQTGCTLVLSGDVSVEQAPGISASIIPNGPLQEGGSIFIDLPNAEDYDFLWSNGSTERNLVGVGNGETYTLTVTSKTGCKFEYQYYIPDCEADGGVIIDLFSTTVRPLDHPDGGGVDLVLVGLTENLSFNWSYSNPSIFTSTEQNLAGIDRAGTYTVTVTDNLCGAIVTRMFKIATSCGEFFAETSEQGQCSDNAQDRVFALKSISRPDYIQGGNSFPTWGKLQFSNSQTSIVSLVYDSNEHGFVPTNPAAASISGFDEGVVGLTFVDEYGCESLPAYRNFSPNVYSSIRHHWSAARFVSEEFEDGETSTIPAILYEFAGLTSCGWVFENGEYRNGPVLQREEDYRRAQFFPNNLEIGDNVCQRGGVIRIDASIVEPGSNNDDDVPLFAEITIPPNTESVFVNDQEEFEGCVFPSHLFEYPANFLNWSTITYGQHPIFAPIAGTDGDNSGIEINITFTTTDEDLVCNEFREELVTFPAQDLRCPEIHRYCDESDNVNYGLLHSVGTAGTTDCKCSARQLPPNQYGNNNMLWKVTYCNLDNNVIIATVPVGPGAQTLEDMNYYFTVSSLPWCNLDVVDGVHTHPVVGDPESCFTPPGGINYENVDFMAIDSGQNDLTNQDASKRLIEAKNTHEVGTELYPNPSRGIVNLNITSVAKEVLRIVISDVNGNSILDKLKTVDQGQSFLQFVLPSELNSGIYFLSIYNEEGIIVTKRFVLI